MMVTGMIVVVMTTVVCHTYPTVDTEEVDSNSLIRRNTRSANHRSSARLTSAGQSARCAVRLSPFAFDSDCAFGRHAPPVAAAIASKSASSGARNRYSIAGSGMNRRSVIPVDGSASVTATAIASAGEASRVASYRPGATCRVVTLPGARSRRFPAIAGDQPSGAVPPSGGGVGDDMANRRNIHVVPNGNGWATRREGSNSITSRHRTQTAAEGSAKSIARREHGEVITHRPDGKIRDRDSFGRSVVTKCRYRIVVVTCACPRTRESRTTSPPCWR